VSNCKIGNGNYVYTWSGGTCVPSCYTGTGPNYFGISAVSIIANTSASGRVTSTGTMTVGQAYNIDKKIDDGNPTTGKVIAVYISGDPIWADGLPSDFLYHNPYNSSVGGSNTTCFDNNGGGGATQYSMEISNGSNPNCALSFQMQGAAR
jgi:hypothetical protein